MRLRRTQSADELRALRAQVLRPGRPLSESIYPGDDDSRAWHGLLEVRSEAPGLFLTIAVASFLPEPFSLEPKLSAMRLRGMATQPDHRGQGLGRRLLDCGLNDLRQGGIEVVWCNARVAAHSFYLRAGFQHRSEIFEMPGIGPHTLMSISL